ncbi:MAG: histidine kinase, partial [Gemmatimonadetes bacterium]|nr:histidine kinase [Gemmatimonadota bacterium]
MAKPRVDAGGGWPAIRYVFRKGRDAGGVWALYKRLRSRNACKTCALGMGGQRGGMVNEKGRFPEVCKKSVQAQAGDMKRTVTEEDFRSASLEALGRRTSAECEAMGRLAFPVMAGPQDTHYRRISWDEALAHAADAFRGTAPDETFFYASGR